MTKSKIFIAAGTLVLGVAGFLASSAHTRFAAVSSAFFKTAGSTFVTLFKGVTSPHLTTTVTAGRTAFYRTGTVNHTLFLTKATTTKLYGK